MSEAKRQRTTNRNAIIVFILFTISLLLGSAPMDTSSVGMRDMAWAVLSFLSFAALLYAMFVSYRQADERQRMVQLQATSISFATVMLGIFVAQLLDAIALVALKPSTQVVFMGGIILWIILLKILERRHS